MHHAVTYYVGRGRGDVLTVGGEALLSIDPVASQCHIEIREKLEDRE